MERRESCFSVRKGLSPTSLLGLYTLRSLAIKSLHFVFLTLHRTRIVILPGKGRSQLDHPHCDPLSSLSLMTSGFRLLQTFYRELFHISRPLHQWVFPLFHVKYYVVTAPLLPVTTYREAEKCRIRSVSRSGSASHAMSDSDILESALPSGACRILVPMTLASYGLMKDGDFREPRTRGHRP